MNRFVLTCVCLSIFLISFLAVDDGTMNLDPIGPYLNNSLPAITPSGSGNTNASYTIENAFPNLTFIDPLKIVDFPGNRLLVAGKSGHLWLVDNTSNANSKLLVLDITGMTNIADDSGLLGVALHPEFTDSNSVGYGNLYVFYRYAPVDDDRQNAYLRLSRFSANVTTGVVDVNSEFVMINQFDRQSWHNGGDVFFGQDGFLYLAIGDEGGANDQYDVTQKINERLFGGLLRIDVDQKGGQISHPIRRQPIQTSGVPPGWSDSQTQGYYIPNDNPWQDVNGTILEEFWAIGTRSPHRVTQDPISGEIWMGDVGQGAREEISIIEKGDNLQWPYREGNIEGPKTKPANLIGVDKEAIYDYGRGIGSCIIGGYLISGNSALKYPELAGSYIFGDHTVQNVWTLSRQPDGSLDQVEFLLNVPQEGVGSKDGISSFGVSADGTIYILDLFGTDQDGGKIHKLVRQTDQSEQAPDLLSELNIFSDLETLTTNSGILPYEVNSPLWSDGASKGRWIALPNDGLLNSMTEKIEFSIEDYWKFPEGTVFIKHFEIPISQDGSTILKLETRIFVITAQGAYGLTYRWNDEQSDAYLIDGMETLDFTKILSDGSSFDQTWTFPSRQQCIDCHNSNTGFVLGFRTRQLNRNLLNPQTGQHYNQLEFWNSADAFQFDLGSALNYPASSNLNNDETSLEFKVRSFLDSNCSNCHRSNGVEGVFDASSKIGLYDQNLINELAISHASPTNSKIIIPGDPTNSLLQIRDSSTGSDKMPPLGRSLVDSQYIIELTSWIQNLPNNETNIVEDWYHISSLNLNNLITGSNDTGYYNVPLHLDFNLNEEYQKWYIQSVDGHYRIVSGLSGDVLSAINYQSETGTAVVLQPWSGSQNQLWYFVEVDGNYMITNVYSGLRLEYHSQLQLERKNSDTSQLWTLSVTSGNGIPELVTNCFSIFLSDLDWESTPTNGWGPVEINQSNGGQDANDGEILTINGTTYTTGIGAHANSEIEYNLAGAYKVLSAEIGAQDRACGATIMFSIEGDGIQLYQSPLMEVNDDPIPIIVNVENVNSLKLIISDGGNGIGCDHGNWASIAVHTCAEGEDVCAQNNVCGCEDIDLDGICDELDQCYGVSDALIGSPCEDGNLCTTGEIFSSNCTCEGGQITDDDNDGVCDIFDICPGGDDSLDMDEDGTPDFCDTCDNSLFGTACDDNDACTIDDIFDNMCNCIGTYQDSDNDGVCDADDSNCTVLFNDNFEIDQGIWNLGGIDAHYIMSAFSPVGNYSLRIRDNSFEASSVYSSVLDLSTSSLVSLTFDYQAVGMEAGEKFVFESSVDEGSSFSLIQTWTEGTEFVNDQVYQDTILIPAQAISSTTILRFQCIGSINSDEIYLDNIKIESCDDDVCMDYVIETQNDQLSNSMQARLGIESNQIIPANANVDLNAGDYILLNSAFEVKANAVFHAFIDGCE